MQDLIARKVGPFQYDAGMHEYSIVSFDGKTKIRLYHCFICGGSLPNSMRGEKFYVIEREEMERIKKLCEGVTTIDEAIAKLGNPDRDYPHGSGVGDIDEESGRKTSIFLRSIRYFNLSKTAEVGFTETKNGSAFLSITGKEIK
ncbi:MAG: hypothetical protein H0W78_14240 [Planctomycetes bacterium]|nr:hypothetical protein [Planctomycetota bacterium]